MTVIKAFFPAAIVMAVCISPAVAAPKTDRQVEILAVNYGGNGCPARSASVSVSPDGQEFSILFDKFITLGNNPSERRKSCNVSIPIKVPKGFQISIYDADYRGYIAPATSANLRTESFFAGEHRSIFSSDLIGETNYNVRHNLESIGNIWSSCGRTVNMRVTATITTQGNGMATIDSVDLSTQRGLTYHLKYRECI